MHCQKCCKTSATVKTTQKILKLLSPQRNREILRQLSLRGHNYLSIFKGRLKNENIEICAFFSSIFVNALATQPKCDREAFSSNRSLTNFCEMPNFLNLSSQYYLALKETQLTKGRQLCNPAVSVFMRRRKLREELFNCFVSSCRKRS